MGRAGAVAACNLSTGDGKKVRLPADVPRSVHRAARAMDAETPAAAEV